MSLLSTAINVLSNQTMLMPVIYISAVAMLLLAVLYAGRPSKRRRLNSDDLRWASVPNSLADAMQNDAQPPPTPPAGSGHTERDPGIDRRFQEIQDELAVLRGKVELLETSGAIREEHQAAASGIAFGSATALLRRELEALSAEISGDS